ncbi:beta-1,3-galactosyltransferase 1 [Lingula anatina]|uniref:Hexosyltransferase n=1 Tax=Lingula anatina TaxID=7574 RepID=A0A1S3H0D5_LINAN|nr:beta-1,3-galactosyltransferase 1 [Lingula anatina]|eukprot:XP_013379397.1 beta-1,3-galactosyltransferase 1 [Lingula anatina]
MERFNISLSRKFAFPVIFLTLAVYTACLLLRITPCTTWRDATSGYDINERDLAETTSRETKKTEQSTRTAKANMHFTKEQGLSDVKSISGTKIEKSEKISRMSGRNKVTRRNRADKSKLHVHRYNYIINPRYFCHNDIFNNSVFLLVMVPSAPENFERRLQLRKTWGSISQALGERISTVFVLGQSSDHKQQERNMLEAEIFRDILKIDFNDTYRNLTLKTLSAMRWALTYCDKAKFIMKADDDIIMQYKLVVRTLLARIAVKNTSDCFMGFVVKDRAPIRDNSSKWHVSENEYAGSKFPPYVNGPSYIMAMPTARKLLSAAFTLPYLSMEDAFLGIAAEKAGVTPENDKRFIPAIWPGDEYSFCAYQHMLTIHDVPENVRQQFWSDLKRAKSFKCPMLDWDNFAWFKMKFGLFEISTTPKRTFKTAKSF